MLNAEGFLVRAAPTQEQLDLLYQQMTMLDQGAGAQIGENLRTRGNSLSGERGVERVAQNSLLNVVR